MRAAVLTAWRAAPARFREDANAEDDLATGPYRDRLVVELAQNACDAGASWLSLVLDDGVLVAANDGAPLTAEGVAALASLRASAKRTGRTVGRFGVGFAAVAAVADEVVVASPTGSVLFSRARAREVVDGVPELAAELAARHGHVPLLRLPFESDATATEGVEVRVTVRPEARERVRAMLDGIDPTLLLVLPGLTTLSVLDRETTAVRDGDDLLLGGTRWRVARAEGSVDPALLAERPVEERAQDRWSVTWAVPLADGRPAPLPTGVSAVLRAPTPTDDPLSLPAVLAASLPLGPDRRRVALGPLADEVLRHAAELLGELVAALPLDPSRLLLVPPPLAAGEVDARLASCVLQVCRPEVVLGHPRPVVLEGASPQLCALLEDVVDGLLPSEWSASRWAAPLARLGARRLSLAELTEVLAGVEREPSWWGELYAALPPDADQLGALPVPLTDGRLAAAPRGLLLTESHVDLSPLGFRVVHPDAAHDLLLRLGAQHSEPRALLEDPRVRAAVESLEEADDEECASVAAAVLDLVGAADLRPGQLPWLGALPLPTVDGDLRPAGELLLPGGPLASVVDQEAGFGVVADGVAHPDVLGAVGVLRSFAFVPVEEAEGVDGLDEWLAGLGPDEQPGLVVRDLDLVKPEAWPEALALLGPDLPPYAVWWLRRHPVLDGERPDRLRRKGTAPLLAGLVDESDHPLVTLTSVAELDPAVLLDRLADPARSVERDQLRALHAHLAGCHHLPLPERVRAVADGELVVVPAEDALVVDRPDLLPRVSPYAVVPVPLELASSLAQALDLPLASEVLGPPPLAGTPVPWGEVPGGYVEHERLDVLTAGGEPVEVPWVAVGHVDHVVGMEGRARALAWRLGRWADRHAVLARLRGDADPDETDLDPV